MPEGDAIHRAARQLHPLVGERVEVETPNPRAAALGLASRLNGKRLEGVEAVGKNLFIRFEGGVTLRSHLRMRGRWRVQRRGEKMVGLPWLVLRGRELEALQLNGPVLELRTDIVSRLGPDVLAASFDLADAVRGLRLAPHLPMGEALQRQSLIAGIGNMWVAETLWAARVSPWRLVDELSDEELENAVMEARRLMKISLESRRPPRRAYRRAGRPCRRCGTSIKSRRLGDIMRTAYWCPTCQTGPP